ncbi:MAG TPA: TonB-dependent receptor, partial [Prolixibacteraceae bacterium]|nr:TonB-dependent receptor [Prolixibacteraceae bacterium]
MKNVVLTALLAISVISANAQNLINGVVTNKQNEPLSGATILVKPGNAETVSNDLGEFVINGLKEGTYKIKISYLGYETFQKTIIVPQSGTIKAQLDKHTFQTKEIIVSSTRATAETPTSQSNIGIEEIKRREAAQDIPYLLQLTPSVVTTSDAGAGIGYTGFRIRGTDLNRINVTVNDIPLNDAESHGVFFVNMPDFIESTNSIQIQRGVGTSSNGAAAFGASVNLQTNQIELLPYAEINNAAGSFNTIKNTVKAGTGLIDGRFAFDARLSRIKSDGFIDRATSNLKSFFVSGTYRGEKDKVRVNVFSGLEKTYQAWEGIPKARLDGDRDAMLLFASLSGYSDEETENLLNSNSRTFNRYLYENQTDNYQQDHYQIFYTRNINNNLTANIAYHQTNGFGYYESYRYNKRLNDFGADTIFLQTDTITRSDIINRKYLDNVFYGGIASVHYNKGRFDITLGGGMNRYDGKHYGEVLWSAYGTQSFNPTQQYYNNKGTKDDANIYMRANIKTTEKLYTYMDVQYRNIQYKIEGLDDDQRDLTQNHAYNFFNPKLGVFVKLSEKASFYFNN